MGNVETVLEGDPGSTPEGEGPGRGRRHRFAVAGIVATLALIAGAVLLVAVVGDGDDPSPAGGGEDAASVVAGDDTVPAVAWNETVPAVAGDDTVPDGAGDGPETAGGEWIELPEPPLSPRTGASAAWTGEEVVVVGGWEFLCPPNADCDPPPDPPFVDGAAYDPAARTWRSIADAPMDVRGVFPAVVDGAVYLLAPGEADRFTLLGYDPVADSWTELPAPLAGGYHELASVGSSLVAYADSDERGEVPDWRFDVTTGEWSELPDDPLPAMYDRSVVAADDGRALLLFGAPLGSDSALAEQPVLGARLDLEMLVWTELPPSPSRGFRAWGVDDRVVLEPHFGGTGGLFDPAINAWAPLPGAQSPSFDDGSVAGTYGRDGAVYVDASGWVFHLPSGRWLEIEPVDDRIVYPLSSVTAVDRDLFVFGGERWTSDGEHGTASDGELLGDAWLWRAPAT